MTVITEILDSNIEPKRKYVLADPKILQSDRNILCFDLMGNRLWQVEEMYKFHSRNDFTSIYMVNDNLFAYCRNGVEAMTDKDNGKFLTTELIK